MTQLLTLTTTQKFPPQADVVGPGQGGPRGLLYEAWVQTETEAYANLSVTAADYRQLVLDNSTASGRLFYDQLRGFTARLSGLLIAPYTGKIAFYLHCSANCQLRVSNTSDPSGAQLLKHWPEGNSRKKVHTEENRKERTQAIEIVKGEAYYIEALHTQPENRQNFLQISLWQFNTKYHRSDSYIVEDERQVIRLVQHRKLETQKITLNGFTNTAAGEVVFTQAGQASARGFTLDPKKASSTWRPTFRQMLENSCQGAVSGVLYTQGGKFMSCSHGQELCQQASWLLIGYTRGNNQSEARSAS